MDRYFNFQVTLALPIDLTCGYGRTNDDFLFCKYADTPVVFSLVLFGKSVSGTRLPHPHDDDTPVPLGKYSGAVLVLPTGLQPLRISGSNSSSLA